MNWLLDLASRGHWWLCGEHFNRCQNSVWSGFKREWEEKHMWRFKGETGVKRGFFKYQRGSVHQYWECPNRGVKWWYEKDRRIPEAMCTVERLVLVVWMVYLNNRKEGRVLGYSTDPFLINLGWASCYFQDMWHTRSVMTSCFPLP